jgi:uncharacterized phage protein gp47/JayE
MLDPFYTGRAKKTIRPENEDNDHYYEGKYLGETTTRQEGIEIAGGKVFQDTQDNTGQDGTADGVGPLDVEPQPGP